MAQEKKGDRAKGPIFVDGEWKYRYPKTGYPAYWQVVIFDVRPDKKKTTTKKYPFTDEPTEVEALAKAHGQVDEMNCAAKLAAGTTIADAMEFYPKYLAEPDGADDEPMSPGAIRTVMFRLRNVFDERLRALPITDLTEADCRAAYELLKSRRAFDTVFGAIGQAKKFLRWCVAKKWARANPMEAIRAKGTKNDGGKGKKQLGFNELAKWKEVAFDLAEKGDVGAVAALLPLYTMLRATMIVTRRVGDVDMQGALVWVRDKQPNRTKRVPEMNCIEEERIWPILHSLTLGRGAGEWLFAGERTRKTGHRDRSWVKEQIQRVCRLAGVSEDTHTHGMRGAAISAATMSGEFLERIQKRAGHAAGSDVTRRAYQSAESISKRRQRATMAALAGGKGQ